MLKIFYTSISVLLLLQLLTAQSGNPNQNDFSNSFGVQIEIGFNSQSLEKIGNKFTKYIEEYNSRNIPLPVQKLYPSSSYFRGSLTYNFTNTFKIKAGVHYTGTKAYSLYGDYSGEIDIKGNVNSTYFLIGFTKLFFEELFIIPYLEFNVGYVLGEYEFSKKMEYNDGSIYFRPETINYSGSGYSLEPSAGVIYRFNVIELNLNIGYSHSLIENFDIRVSENNQVTYLAEDQKFDFDMDLSGFIIKAGVAIGFF